ncbi:peptide chain release factor 1 [Micavibrio aeruginosavorus]|uniref:Peptide chain release factor 1 n=1 Tax=Micavibrio aeruginosavorus EPB TaxID=349215 RepID=M4VI58_9BACT|nr:peptide chain release factor 1 [Micavibrio aeruginosavorus]AGH98170.1 Peptide chain release factor 1 [Micavibrio aeruginosavorus EPB]
MALKDKMGPIKARHSELAALMGEGNLSGEAYVKLSREYAELGPVVETIDAYDAAVREMADLEAMLSDKDMAEMAQEELYALKDRLPLLEEQVKLALIPKDEADSRNAILEIRAGTGGDEAALFAADLFAMYRGYAATRGWRFEVAEMSENDLGGYKEIIVEVQGADVFSRLKYESGGHRVQRIPVTEAGGRIHTSAATVAVMPEAEDVDIHIDEKDLRIDVYRAQGAGGQHVNKTESAVRITHIPTGTVAACQEGKSQHKNRDTAMKMLRSKLYEAQWRKQAEERSANRKSQVGSGDRSERIRTYNFPQGRVTDHRINMTLYALDDVLSGKDLDKFIDALISEENAEKLAELE